jgi:hypothetical protein
MARRRNANLPGLRPVGTIPGYATEIQYLRNGRTAYYHPFGQPGRVRMIALADGSVQLKGTRRIHADDREPGFDRYTRGNPRRANPGGSFGMMELVLLGAAAWFLLRTPADGSPNLLHSLLDSVSNHLPPVASAPAPSGFRQLGAPDPVAGPPALTTAYAAAVMPQRSPFDVLLHGSGYYGAEAAAQPPH